MIYRHLADLVVPELCDICIIDAFDEDGLLDETALAATRQHHADLIHEMRTPRPLPVATGSGACVGPSAARDPSLVSQITDDQLVGRGPATGLTSTCSGSDGTPLGDDGAADRQRSGDRRADPDRDHDSRGYDEDDLALAENLATRAATAVTTPPVRVAEYRRPSVTGDVAASSVAVPAGMELAARYRVAEGDIEIGGDFYDVFEVGGGRWAAVIGDVCGRAPRRRRHRPDAASRCAPRRCATTGRAMSSARPTTRSSIRSTTPGSARRRCRCASRPAAERPAELMVSCGGHPRPIVLRDDGSVERVHAPGTLLGVRAEPAAGRRGRHTRTGQFARALHATVSRRRAAAVSSSASVVDDLITDRHHPGAAGAEITAQNERRGRTTTATTWRSWCSRVDPD